MKNYLHSQTPTMSITPDLIAKIDRIERENKEMKEEIKFLKACLNPSPYLQVNFLVPVDQKWNIVKSTKSTLTHSGKSFTVEASDVYSCDSNTFTPDLLFNGHKENENGSCWHTNNNQTSAFIQISFDHPVVANVLTMTSRDTSNVNQTPSTFEVFGIDSSNNIQSFKKFYNVAWTENDKKLFTFCNTKPYVSYKIMFYSTIQGGKCYGLSEMNLGAFTI